MPPPMGAWLCGFSSRSSASRQSVVRSIPAIEAAFSRATRVTLVGSITPAATRFSYTSVRALRGNDHQLVIVFYFSFVSLPLIGPFAAYTWVPPSLADWLIIAAIGFLTWLAQISMTMAYKMSPASEVAIYNNLGIFIALILGYYCFGETFTLQSLLGMGVIFLSVILYLKNCLR